MLGITIMLFLLFMGLGCINDTLRQILDELRSRK